MSPLLLYTVLQTLSFSQGFDVTHDLPHGNVTMSADNSAIGLSMLSLSRGCSGILRARHRDITVDVTLNLLDAQEQKDLADQVCQSLGCGKNHVVNATDRSGVCLADCILKESELHNCTTTAKDNCTNATEVICEHQVVRLVGGQDRCVGRVELLNTGQWGTVCDDYFNNTSGNVVCSQLGCGFVVKYGFWGAGSGPIYISKMKCNGTEDNLWECNINNTIPRDYCGHKEDVGIVCSESTVFTSITSNTTLTVFTKWTTESSTEAATVAGASPAVTGCIILSIALLLFILSNAAVCVHFRRRKVCEIEQHHSGSQESTDYHEYTAVYSRQNATYDAQRYESLAPRQASSYGPTLNRSAHNCVCLSDSDYTHHNSDQAQQLNLQNLPAVNVDDSSSTSSEEAYQYTSVQHGQLTVSSMDTIQKLGDGIPSHVDTLTLTPLAIGGAELPFTQSQAKYLNDSSSTSSGEFYENPKTDVDTIQTSQDEEASHEKSPLMSVPNDNQDLQPTENANDSHSISSGEVYENTAVDIDDNLQPENEGSPLLPEQPLQTPLDVQMAGNTGGYSGTHSQADGNELDSTSSDECYQNIELDADASLQSGKGSPAPPETSLQTPLDVQMAGNTACYSGTRSQADGNELDSTSSDECYQNIELDADASLQSGKENPTPPEMSLQTPLDVQMAGNTACYSGTRSQADGNELDSTSSDECYQNIELDADASLQSGKGSPAPPETSLQMPLNHHSTQMTGSTVGYEDHHIPRKLSQEADNGSTSSEDSYVNVPPRNVSDDECSPAECSSDSEYDQPENW